MHVERPISSAWRGILSLRDPAALPGRLGHPTENQQTTSNAGGSSPKGLDPPYLAAGLLTLARRASEGPTTVDCRLEVAQMCKLGRRSPSLARRASVSGRSETRGSLEWRTWTSSSATFAR